MHEIFQDFSLKFTNVLAEQLQFNLKDEKKVKET